MEMKRSANIFPFLLTTLALISPDYYASAVYYGGIPVPGRSVPAIRTFELFLNTCRSSPTLEKLYRVIRNVNADQIAEKMQRNLYFAVDDLDVGAMMGKWFTMIYEPSVQLDQCVVNYFKLLDQSPNFASFSTLQYSLRPSDGSTRLWHGMGRKYGPDAGSLLISTGQPAEPCPYFPVKAGPIKEGKYAYLVLTQALKQPTLVLARDPFEFNLLYREEVHDYLTRFGYWRNPLTGGDLQEANWTKCSQQSLFYTEIDGENEDGEEDINGRREGEGLLGQLEGKER